MFWGEDFSGARSPSSCLKRYTLNHGIGALQVEPTRAFLVPSGFKTWACGDVQVISCEKGVYRML